jgi:hypothetical protein
MKGRTAAALDAACARASPALRLPRPGQNAHRRALLGGEQTFQCLGLRPGQAAGEMSGDVPFGQHQAGGEQAFDHARARGDDAAAAQFVHQRRGDREGVRGGQRHRQ